MKCSLFFLKTDLLQQRKVRRRKSSATGWNISICNIVKTKRSLFFQCFCFQDFCFYGYHWPTVKDSDSESPLQQAAQAAPAVPAVQAVPVATAEAAPAVVALRQRAEAKQCGCGEKWCVSAWKGWFLVPELHFHIWDDWCHELMVVVYVLKIFYITNQVL